MYNVTGTSKTISGLEPKTSHTYAVRAKNSTQTGAYSATKSITTLAQSPGVPSNIRKTVTETAVTLTWNAVTGARYYRLKFGKEDILVNGTSYTLKGLTANTSYSYQVRSHCNRYEKFRYGKVECGDRSHRI